MSSLDAVDTVHRCHEAVPKPEALQAKVVICLVEEEEAGFGLGCSSRASATGAEH